MCRHSLVHDELTPDSLLTVTASMDDGSGNGFTEGNEITFRLWDAGEETEQTGITAAFVNISTGEPIESVLFEGNADVGVKLNPDINLYQAIQILKIMAGIKDDAITSVQDMNSDKRIGTEEAVYFLQLSAGLRKE